MRLTYDDRMTSSSVLPPPAARPSRVEALQMKAYRGLAALGQAMPVDRDEYPQWTMTVRATWLLAPRLRRLTFAAEEFRTFTPQGCDEYFGLLTPPPGSAPTVHDPTIAWALQHGVPLVGPLGSDEGGTATLRPVAGSRLAGRLGDGPVELPGHGSGARTGDEYLAPSGTVWSAQAHRAEAAAVVAAGSTPFAVLTDHALATGSGLHPVLFDFVAAVRARAGTLAPAHPALAARGRSDLAPLPDDEPRSYVHQMRTHGYRWWRPFLALFAGCATFFAAFLVLGTLWVVLDPSLMEAGAADEVDATSPVTMLINNLILAALIPAALVATRVGHWRPMGALWSVAGRLRWRWLGLASLVTLVVWGGYLVLMWVLDGGEVGNRPDHWPWLLVITLLTTPLQAAGEEVAFRGGLLQGVGAWIKNPVVALVVGMVLSTALFALAHMSLDPWILLDLGAMAAACCYLTWRTGGLEAAIVLHVVNNLVLIVMLTLVGGLADAYVTEQTTSTLGAAGISALSTLVMTAILLWLARRAGIAPKRLGAPATNEPVTPTR